MYGSLYVCFTSEKRYICEIYNITKLVVSMSFMIDEKLFQGRKNWNAFTNSYPRNWGYSFAKSTND